MTMSHTETQTKLAGPEDLLWGAAAIAGVINRTRRDTYHLLENRTIPARKVGGRYVASRMTLLEYLRGNTANEGARA